MASDREYRIVVEIDESSSVSGGASEGVAGAKRKSSTKSAEAASSGELKKQAKNFGQAMIAYNAIKSFALQQINYRVSTVELRTGSSEMGARAALQNEIAQKGLGILEMTAAGALVGGGVGAIIGFGLSTAHTAIGYLQKENTIQIKRNLENETLTMLRIRAGASGSRGANQ